MCLDGSALLLVSTLLRLDSLTTALRTRGSSSTTMIEFHRAALTAPAANRGDGHTVGRLALRSSRRGNERLSSSRNAPQVYSGLSSGDSTYTNPPSSRGSSASRSERLPFSSTDFLLHTSPPRRENDRPSAPRNTPQVNPGYGPGFGIAPLRIAPQGNPRRRATYTVETETVITYANTRRDNQDRDLPTGLLPPIGEAEARRRNRESWLKPALKK
ncbi:hypothetical protein BU23DRAFT_562864 [Bimuria novae-zelandiae CBS 107.79]|uniref:Uncharacterized protein n=1 Tax=Bimuria novae-zelandiae CBS 107.79 TaxID=1447943 RepID=A0A6A5W4V5_9PLEO|nr:hypothetical protein BU23DRAFT_562864 [Bimuria novae-zelandiae CBS 107.79]